LREAIRSANQLRPELVKTRVGERLSRLLPCWTVAESEDQSYTADAVPL